MIRSADFSVEPSDPIWSEKVLAVVDLLVGSGVPFALGGAIAMNYHREPRSTLDIDINIFLSPGSQAAVLSALGGLMELGAAEESVLVETVERDGQARALWGTTYVDLFFADTAFHDAMAERVQMQPFAGRATPVLSIEDLLICKALFDRPKDWLDIAAVAAHEPGRLDVDYIVFWLRYFLDPSDSRFRQLGDLLG